MGAKAVGIKTDEFGMIPSELEKAAQSGKGKYIYLIPISKIQQVLQCRWNAVKKFTLLPLNMICLSMKMIHTVRFAFAGEYIPTFKSFDTENRVLYAGSYSKTLSAGLRVGFLFGPAKVIEAIQALKNNTAGQMPLVTQKVVAKVLDTIDYDEHLDNVRKVYKMNAMLYLTLLTSMPALKFI